MDIQCSVVIYRSFTCIHRQNHASNQTNHMLNCESQQDSAKQGWL